MKSNNRLVRLAVLQALTCASGLMLAAPGSASADPARFDISAEPLPNALKHFAAQAKMQLLYRYDVVSHATATPVTGQLEKHAALRAIAARNGIGSCLQRREYRDHSRYFRGRQDGRRHQGLERHGR